MNNPLRWFNALKYYDYGGNPSFQSEYFLLWMKQQRIWSVYVWGVLSALWWHYNLALNGNRRSWYVSVRYLLYLLLIFIFNWSSFSQTDNWRQSFTSKSSYRRVGSVYATSRTFFTTEVAFYCSKIPFGRATTEILQRRDLLLLYCCYIDKSNSNTMTRTVHLQRCTQWIKTIYSTSSSIRDYFENKLCVFAVKVHCTSFYTWQYYI